MKSIFLAFFTLVMCVSASAYELRVGNQYIGVTNSEDPKDCKVEVSKSIDTIIISLSIDHQYVYGFVTETKALEELSTKRSASDLRIAGNLDQPGNVELSITVKNNIVKSFKYSGVHYKTGEIYSVSCVIPKFD